MPHEGSQSRPKTGYGQTQTKAEPPPKEWNRARFLPTKTAKAAIPPRGISLLRFLPHIMNRRWECASIDAMGDLNFARLSKSQEP